jgi:hypothetical protein
MKKKLLLIPVLAGILIVGYLYFNKSEVTVTKGTSPDGEIVVQVHEKKYENEDMYLNILRDWDSGNFDNVVRAHNSIWSLQDGTVGKAYEMASPEEEMEYLQKSFTVKQ